MAILPKLDAVNSILEAIGESPVNSLSSGNADAEAAERKIDEITKQVLAKGWDCNTFYDLRLTPNNAGEIVLPSNTLKVDSSDTDAGRKVTFRAGKLYDLEKNSFVFTAPVTVNLVELQAFDDLPYALANYIMCRAGRIFQEGSMGSATLDGFTKRREEEAWAAWQDENADTSNDNVLQSSPSVRTIAYRRNHLWGN